MSQMHTRAGEQSQWAGPLTTVVKQGVKRIITVEDSLAVCFVSVSLCGGSRRCAAAAAAAVPDGVALTRKRLQ